MHYAALLSNYPIISDQIDQPALAVVLRELESTLQRGVVGDIAEFGCYIGTTSLFIRRLLDTVDTSKQFYAYDSFVGLPDKNDYDQSRVGDAFQGGELRVSKKQFLQVFQKANLTPPITHKGWFKDLSVIQLPESLAFAFLDGDFYESILDSLKLAWPRLQKGGVLTVDDYAREALPGVTQAVHDFFGGTPSNLRYEHNIAIIKRG